MIELCTQCKQMVDIPVDKWVCSYCESKSTKIAKEFEITWPK